MGRRGNPYDNAKAESFMKTLKVEEVYLVANETSTTWRPHCRASSTRSTTASDCNPRSDTAAPSPSRR